MVQSGFERRYAMYMENSRPESSVETFFEENEVVCRTVESEEDAVDAILKVVQTDVGPPRNYGLTPEELCAIEEQERQRLVRITFPTIARWCSCCISPCLWPQQSPQQCSW